MPSKERRLIGCASLARRPAAARLVPAWPAEDSDAALHESLRP